ncbi:type II toxin-antitoxin system HigB family toxin [Anabaena aphanizomenioides LEGE 00250]|uniref:Type II toxin-antitoxin system HigB family toxin n=1 Tax=Sphaerospermopsis aphanizomenoides LEGE 00250 TaxID=2777972 RepID=A0ABR9V7Z1_9CYAN|nr:type II toxin-antitoxin system HigB family toxin [Sphaerospermopsis aphanizomenoides]MBE9234608.1 type II toxin-antitoxin system HigB family toxin [Sphaerospermopsis aphanizomenoides LEGE 00250]
MRIISTSKLKQDANEYPDLKQIIDSWCLVVKRVTWNHLEDVKNVYPSAEAVGNFTVFNLKGNKYHLIVGIDYVKQIIYYKYLLTHAEYDKDRWENDPYY